MRKAPVESAASRGKIVCRRLKIAVIDTCLPRAGHDFRTFKLQTTARFTYDSRFQHALCKGPCVHDPRRVRASPDRACRQSRDPHRRKGRDGGERLARRIARPSNLDPGPRWKVASLDCQICAELTSFGSQAEAGPGEGDPGPRNTGTASCRDDRISWCQ